MLAEYNCPNNQFPHRKARNPISCTGVGTNATIDPALKGSVYIATLIRRVAATRVRNILQLLHSRSHLGCVRSLASLCRSVIVLIVLRGLYNEVLMEPVTIHGIAGAVVCIVDVIS